jgi:dihydroorotase
MFINNLILPRLDDLHVHLRQDEMLEWTASETYKGGAGRVLAMPNLKPPVITCEQALNYKSELQKVNSDLDYLMCLYLHESLTPEDLQKSKQNGINNLKMYPAGVTTNSQYGVDNIKSFYPLFEVMQSLDMIFNIHGEVPSNDSANICVLNAEISFLPILEQIHADFPKLRMILEHITTKEAVQFVSNANDRISATITVHHLDLTVDNWAGQNHNFCKPVAKYPVDRDALREVVKSGSHKFFLGSDSAPHKKETKETVCGCAGVYTASYLASYLADCFERLDCLDNLTNFATKFGADFYRLPYQKEMINLEKKPTVVASEINGVVPFRAGQTLNWTLN